MHIIKEKHWRGATYRDIGGGTLALSSTPSSGAPFDQFDTSYLVSLTITPNGESSEWVNSTIKIGCLPLVV